MSHNILEPQAGDHWMTTLGRGAALGGAGLAAVYGLNDLKNFLMRKLEPDLTVLPENLSFNVNLEEEQDDLDFKYAMYEPKEIEKIAGLEDVNLLKRYTYGAGVPLGIYGTYKLLSFLKDKEQQYSLRNSFREFSERVKESDDSRARRREFEKMIGDPELNTLLDSTLEKIAEEVSTVKKADAIPGTWPAMMTSIWDMGTKGINLAETLYYKLPAIYGPTGLGALSGLSFLAGYEGAKYLDRPEESAEEHLINVPNLKYKLGDKDDSKTI